MYGTWKCDEDFFSFNLVQDHKYPGLTVYWTHDTVISDYDLFKVSYKQWPPLLPVGVVAKLLDVL